MVLVCLPSDALSQHLPSYLAFSYLGGGVSLHGCSSKVKPLLLTLYEGYLLMAAPSDLERGVAPLSPPAPAQQPLLGKPLFNEYFTRHKLSNNFSLFMMFLNTSLKLDVVKVQAFLIIFHFSTEYKLIQLKIRASLKDPSCKSTLYYIPLSSTL